MAIERDASLIQPAPHATLSGDAAESYITLLIQLLEAGRLNKFYTDPARLAALYGFLRPSRNFGLYPEVHVNLRSGLPAEQDVTRVLADADLSPRVLAETTREELQAQLEESGLPAMRRRLLRYDYHQALLQAALPSPFSLALALRRVDPATRTAHFTVTFDRFDLGDGEFVRYTIVLAQIDSRWTRQQVELVGDDLKYTENFRNVISRFTAHEAEFAFILLSDLRNIKVEEVLRCRVGPLFFRDSQYPADWAKLFGKYPAAFVLNLPMERAGRTVTQDGTNDPLAGLYRSFLSPEAREPLERRVTQLGYHVWKDRKFTCTRDVHDPLKELLQSRGTRCVIQPLP